jgi:uncharacterized protein DUF1877
VGIYGEYLRTTADELARVVEDPALARQLVEDSRDAEENSDFSPAEARHLSTEKAWQAIAFLLERANFPVDIVYGEGRFAGVEDWGYGPPRYLTVERVAVAAGALATTSFEALTVGVTKAALAKAPIYPDLGGDPDPLGWIRDCYAPLVPYFAAAAMRAEALLIWLG